MFCGVGRVAGSMVSREAVGFLPSVRSAQGSLLGTFRRLGDVRDVEIASRWHVDGHADSLVR